MKKSALIILVLIFGVSFPGFGAGASEKAAEAPKTIKIALSAPFTGLGSILGDYIKEGALLAVDEINAAGGVNGAKFELVVYDDKADASMAATVVRRALFDDKAVAIFGPNMSSAVLGVHTLAQQARRPMLVGATSPSFRYDKVKNDFLFRLRADDGVKVAQQVKYIVENLKAKKPGVIYGSTDYCTSALDVAKETFAKYGIQIVAMEQMKEGDKDATGQILKLKNAGIDCLVGLTHEPEAAVVVKQVRQLQLNVPIVGFSAWGVPAFTDLAGEAAKGVISVQGFNPADTDPVVKKFVDSYKAKWGREPSDPAQCYYDGVYVLKEAIKLAGSTDPEKIAEALKKVEYNGVQGRMKLDALHNFTNVCYISEFDGKNWKIIAKL
jgi:branched-chain amino acid transport system substrate-binding protein